MRQRVGLALGLILFALMLLIPTPEGMSPEGQRVAAVTLLMASWWISEAIPIAATALLPLLLFPLLQVLPTAKVAPAYAHHLVMLFLGGFLIAVALQRCNLHRRIALHTIRLVGVSPRRTVLGFMLATALLSMWISNTATTMMMLPIGLAVIGQLSQWQQDEASGRAFGTALMLGIAYAASIGGVATLIGTPPNAILAGMLDKLYGINLSFTTWLAIGLPLSLVMLPLAWLYLTRIAFRLPAGGDQSVKGVIHNELGKLGAMSVAERRVLVIFSTVALLWIIRGLVDWPLFSGVSDASIAIGGALMLFILPNGQGERLLDWASAATIPWDVLLLFGGGFALAGGFANSGLTQWMVTQISMPPGTALIAIALVVTLLVIFLTEVTSNTATATIVVPLMGALAQGMGTAPALLMVPAAVAASYAFMLPVATPPNAIVFSSRYISMGQMARCGLWLNLLAAALITLFATLWVPRFLA